MKKYFYTNGIEKIGPFSFEELKIQNLTRETKVWYYGLENWTPLSEIDELKTITNQIPPQLKGTFPRGIYEKNETKNTLFENKTIKQPPKKNRALKRGIVISLVSIIAFAFIYIAYIKQKERELYQKIASSAYETDVDFDFYVDKFYRDIGVYGIFPKKPIKKNIKFAKFDNIDNATHYHGVSYGSNDNDRIEIYINHSTWEEFTKPMRYYLMYHELAHDVLNIDDLENIPKNEGRLMYPVISSYESKTMDDFIENSHTLFEEVSSIKTKEYLSFDEQTINDNEKIISTNSSIQNPELYNFYFALKQNNYIQGLPDDFSKFELYLKDTSKLKLFYSSLKLNPNIPNIPSTYESFLSSLNLNRLQ
jgi:hypothetical protein